MQMKQLIFKKPPVSLSSNLNHILRLCCLLPMKSINTRHMETHMCLTSINNRHTWKLMFGFQRSKS